MSLKAQRSPDGVTQRAIIVHEEYAARSHHQASIADDS